MHNEVLTANQIELLPVVKKFSNTFGLVGGTAIALQIGHRRSIDFDLFTLDNFNNLKIRKKITQSGQRINKVYKDEKGQFTFIIDNVQFTFFNYPYELKYHLTFEKTIRMPDLLTLAAMKAFALSRRAKWKDYVDLFFIIKDFHSIKDITKKGRELFDGEFNERVFREGLAFFKDINYSEPVEFLPGFEVDENIVKKELIKFSLQ